MIFLIYLLFPKLVLQHHFLPLSIQLVFLLFNLWIFPTTPSALLSTCLNMLPLRQNLAIPTAPSSVNYFICLCCLLPWHWLCHHYPRKVLHGSQSHPLHGPQMCRPSPTCYHWLGTTLLAPVSFPQASWCPFHFPIHDLDTHVPQASSFLKLVGYVDSAHANNLHQCCSTTGYVFLLNMVMPSPGTHHCHLLYQGQSPCCISALSCNKSALLSPGLLYFLRITSLPPAWSMPWSPPNALATLTSSTLPFKTGADKAILNSDISLTSSIPLKTLPRLLAGFYTPAMPATSWDILACPSSSNFFYSPFLSIVSLSSFTFHPLIFFCSVYSVTDQWMVLAPRFHSHLKVLAQQYFTEQFPGVFCCLH